MILKHIQTYPFDLFKVKLNQALLSEMVKADLFGLASFFSKSAKTPSFLKQFDRANIEI